MSGSYAPRLRLFAALLSAAACLVASFVAAGAWILAGAVLLPGLLLSFLSQRPRGGWMAALYLVAMAAAVAAAALLGAPAFLVVPGAALSLAAWDLAAFDRALRAASAGYGGALHDGVADNVLDDEEPVRRDLEKRHLVRLGQALILGLLIAGGGMLISLTLPFWAMVALVAVDLVCLGSVFRFFKR
jgi:hypothetical protein